MGKLKGSSLVEILVAMLIISAVTMIWTTMYLRIYTHDNSIQEECGKKIFQEVKNTRVQANYITSCKGIEWQVFASLDHQGLMFIEVVSINRKPEIKHQCLKVN